MTSAAKSHPRALLIHQAALGDFLIACRLIEFCNQRLGSHRWSCLGKSSHGRLAKSLGLIDAFDDFDSSGWYLLFTPDHAIPDRITSFLHQFDLIVNVISGPDTLFARRLTELAIGRVLHADPKLPANYEGHVFKYLAEQLQIGPVVELPRTVFTVDPALVAQVRQTVATDRLALFHPGASKPAKRWPVAHFIRRMQEARQAGDEPGILLGEVEVEQFTPAALQALQSHGRPFIDWPLENLAALLTLSKQYLGNDNGVSHLAAVVGADTTVVFIEPNAHHWHPLGPQVHIHIP